MRLTAIPVKANVARTGYGNVLSVNVNPDRGKAFYEFTVQKRSSTGKWSTMSGVYRTQGNAETRSITLPKGAYRVVVTGKYGYKGATSASVTLVK